MKTGCRVNNNFFLTYEILFSYFLVSKLDN